jgi:hypothetical protein
MSLRASCSRVGDCFGVSSQRQRRLRSPWFARASCSRVGDCFGVASQRQRRLRIPWFARASCSRVGDCFGVASQRLLRCRCNLALLFGYVFVKKGRTFLPQSLRGYAEAISFQLLDFECFKISSVI